MSAHDLNALPPRVPIESVQTTLGLLAAAPGMSSGLEARVDGIVHPPTQRRDGGLDVTVGEVVAFDGAGRIDFGGGEYRSAATTPVERYWRNDDDDYQWWALEEGAYAIEYNESLTGGGRVRLHPSPELVGVAATHPTIPASSIPVMPLFVGAPGVHIKENARVTTLRPAVTRDSSAQAGEA